MTSFALRDTVDKSPGESAALEVVAIAADLERLKGLISDAGDRLLEIFDAVGVVSAELAEEGHRAQMRAVVARAVTALQFPDIAMQLTNHAQVRLSALQDCLESMPGDMSASFSAMPPPVLAHPVAQAEMSAGSIELF